MNIKIICRLLSELLNQSVHFHYYLLFREVFLHHFRVYLFGFLTYFIVNFNICWQYIHVVTYSTYIHVVTIRCLQISFHEYFVGYTSYSYFSYLCLLCVLWHTRKRALKAHVWFHSCFYTELLYEETDSSVRVVSKPIKCHLKECIA